MKQMIRGLIHGNVRGWGITQYQQYARALGNRKKVGIELEITGTPTKEILERLLEVGFKISRGEDIYTLIMQTKSEYEITYLFDVTNAMNFYREALIVYTTLKSLGVPTYGSTHVNVQVPKSLGTYVMVEGIHNDIEGDATKYRRLEYKKGPIWTNHKELIGGIITITSQKKEVALYVDKLVRPKLLSMKEVWDANFVNKIPTRARLLGCTRR